jgi:hypothetical protein
VRRVVGNVDFGKCWLLVPRGAWRKDLVEFSNKYLPYITVRIYIQWEWDGLIQALFFIPAICKLKPSTGKCRGYFVSWYYDHASADCKKFVYGGCGGNANRFEEHLPCLVRCGLLGVLYPPSKSAGLLSHEEL